MYAAYAAVHSLTTAGSGPRHLAMPRAWVMIMELTRGRFGMEPPRIMPAPQTRHPSSAVPSRCSAITPEAQAVLDTAGGWHNREHSPAIGAGCLSNGAKSAGHQG